MSSGDDAATLRDRIGLALSGADVRIFSRDDQLWFAINDVAAALGVSRRSLDYHIGHLPDDERRHIPRPSRLPSDIVVGTPGLHCVSLTGMFKLLLRTHSPAAETFQNWVCRALLIPLWDGSHSDARQGLQDDSGEGSSASPVSP